jgi:hypothetical protein
MRELKFGLANTVHTQVYVDDCIFGDLPAQKKGIYTVHVCGSGQPY